jgi:hypothetical protein
MHKASALELADALHPSAAVGGTPTLKALELISELEGMERGHYAGPVGWIDASGDGEFGITLRSAALDGNRVRLFAGAGGRRRLRPRGGARRDRHQVGAGQGRAGRLTASQQGRLVAFDPENVLAASDTRKPITSPIPTIALKALTSAKSRPSPSRNE